MTTDIIKVVATLAISIVFDSCHNVRETVEEAAVHADVSYDVKESEKEIISATNDFSFRLFQYLTDNNKENNLIISPLGVVYSLEIIGNGADGETRQKLQQYLGTDKYDQADINALRRRMMLCHAKVSLDEFLDTKTAFMKSSNLFLYRDEQTIKQDYIQTIGHDYFADCLSYQNEDDAKSTVDTWNKETNHGAIKDIPLEFDDNSVAYLINTLLFNGAWIQEFYDAKPDTFYVTNQLLKDRRKLGLPEDIFFIQRFYIQTICNCVRLRLCPQQVQEQVFLKTCELFEYYMISLLKDYKTLYESLTNKDFVLYKRFCLAYSKVYLS